MRLSVFALLLLATACQSIAEKTAAEVPENQKPVPGTVVATDSIRHTEDLNTFMFRVTVTKAPEAGVYTVVATDGPNGGTTQFTLPKGAAHYPVVMRRNGETRMQIGFRTPDDTTFYPYYEVASGNKTIRAQYTNAYTFE